MSSERRRAPRIAIAGKLHGSSVTFDVPITVRDFSLGGMAIETEFPFPAGAVDGFQITLGDGAIVDLRGQIKHSRPEVTPDGRTVYVTGVEFVGDDVDEDAEGVLKQLS